jgi:hypothetical protein
MKTVSYALPILAMVIFVLTGCADRSNLLAPSDEPAVVGSTTPATAAPLAKAATVKHSVAGSTQIFIYEGPNNFAMPFRHHYTFNAKEMSDGSVSGTLQLLEPNGSVKAHAKIVGLKVDANKAKLECQFTSGPWAGLYAFNVVIDNGEGANSGAADQITLLAIYEGEPFPTLDDWMAMSPADFLAFLTAAQPYIPMYVVQDIEGGNIQVR